MASRVNGWADGRLDRSGGRGREIGRLPQRDRETEN